MTSTERVMAAVAFQTPDRIPMCDSFWPAFIRRWRGEMGHEDTADPKDHYGIDVSVVVGDECFFPSRRALLTSDADTETWNDGWGQIVRTGRRDSYFSQTIRRALREKGDLDGLRFEPADHDARFAEPFSEHLERERASARCIFAKVGGIYIRSHFLYGEERLLMDMALDRPFCNALFDRVCDHLTGMALETLRRTDAWQTGLWVYDDMANVQSTMFSPRLFEEYLLPRYRRLIDTCRAAGCRHFFFHSDGNIAGILDMLIEAGFQGCNPLEPRCGFDAVDLRRRFGKRLVVFGGVCNTKVLPRGDHREIVRHVQPLIDLGREGGIIIGSASIGDDVRPRVYDLYRRHVHEAGRYIPPI